MSATDFQAVVSNTPILDLTAFNFWLYGLPVDAAAESLERRHPKAPRRQILRAWLTDNYRIFESLEPFLEEPETFREQNVWPLPPELRAVLVERYYRFDPGIMKEMLGKKLNNRTRKAAEDYCLRNRLPTYTGRRTFDNLKRITKQVEDLEGDMKEHIRRIYMMPPEMASQYANVLFINVLRLDTTKKKLQYLKFADYDYITSVIARLWSPGVESGISTAVDLSWGTLDPLIPQDCRELKHVCNSFKSDVLDDLRARVAAAMTAAFIASGAETTTMATTSSCSVPPSKPTAGHTPPITASSSVAAGIANTDPATPNGQPQIVYPAALILERSGTTMLDPKSGPNFFRAMIRSAIAIGIGLGSAKELRDFFMNMLEKIVEPCIAVGWSSTDADFFFVALRDVILQSQLIPQGVRGKFARTWPRLIEGIRLIAERMRLNPAPVGASSVSLAMRSAVSSPAGTSAANVSSNNASERPKRSLFGSTASFTKSFLDRVTRGGD